MKKQIAKGAAIGLLIPIVFVAILYLVFYLFDKVISDQVMSSSLLFAIGLNALVMRYYFKKNNDYMARGIMLASFICFIFLAVKYII